MGLEQADQLVRGRHRLAGQNPTLGLGDDLLDQGPIVADLACQREAAKSAAVARRVVAQCREANVARVRLISSR
jgi:hypothetical protein